MALDGRPGESSGAVLITDPEEAIRPFESMPFFVVLVDESHHLLAANQAFRDYFQVTPEQVKGAYCPRLVHGTDCSFPGCPLEESIENQGVTVEKELHNPDDGIWVYSCIYPTPLITPEGSRIFLHTVRDITEEKRTKQALDETEARLHQAQKMEAIGRLAGGIAHDFNNLLTSIGGHTELLLAEAEMPEAWLEQLKQVHRASLRAGQLTRQLLTFARKQQVQPKELDLNATVEDLVRMIRRLIGEDIEVRTVLSENVGYVRVDPGHFDQVLMNLAVNARDAMPEGGVLSIATSTVTVDVTGSYGTYYIEPGEYVTVTVVDSGCGMDRETLDQIFEPFFTTKEEGKGTGLGLATVYGIVRQAGGEIHVHSEPGQGTAFEVLLPRAEAAAPDASAPGERPQFEPAREAERVLVVEDDDAVRRLVEMALKRGGYTVVSAETPQQARQVLDAEEPFALLLTDVVMPGTSGLDLAREVLARGAPIQVLFMSGYADQGPAAHSLLDGSVPFLQKPFSSVELLRQVRQLLDRAREA